MKALFLTNEYPPNIYGGAGVHVDYLSRELAKLIDLEVRCFGKQKVHSKSLDVRGFSPDKSGYKCPENLVSVFSAAQHCLDFNTAGIDADVVHCHTWYSHLGGIFAKLNYGIPLVITIHSLEPLRPWKREQLGGGYDFSLWVEKTAIEMADAVIAVSKETAADVKKYFKVAPSKLHTIYNGIDLAEYKHVEKQAALQRLGVNPQIPYILFVGRITRQKGIIHLVNAIKHLDPGFQVVLCAGAPDTPEIAKEMKKAVGEAQKKRDGIIWIEEMLDNKAKIELYSHARIFVCPSIYEPFGIINLEAMACGVPVIASAVGGIKEVVVHGETGYLVSVDQMKESPFEVKNSAAFASDLALNINELMADGQKRRAFGQAGRRRVEKLFAWSTIAKQIADLYESLIKS
ncbi:MAG: glycogen synthase [Chthoniobacterales bacterium]